MLALTIAPRAMNGSAASGGPSFTRANPSASSIASSGACSTNAEEAELADDGGGEDAERDDGAELKKGASEDSCLAAGEEVDHLGDACSWAWEVGHSAERGDWEEPGDEEGDEDESDEAEMRATEFYGGG